MSEFHEKIRCFRGRYALLNIFSVKDDNMMRCLGPAFGRRCWQTKRLRGRGIKEAL